MSGFDDAINGLKTVLEANITGLHVFNHPPASVNQFPAAVIQVEPFDPNLAFGGNSIELDLRVTFLFGSADSEEAFQQVYDAIDPTETSSSVIAAVNNDRTLNGKVDDATCVGIENVGRREIGQGNMAGFDALIRFIKSIS